MADTMIERIARILAAEAGYLGDDAWRNRTEQAKRVLNALRLSDSDTFGNQNDSLIAMLMAGSAVLPEHDEPMQEDAANCWNAMIDAALGQEG